MHYSLVTITSAHGRPATPGPMRCRRCDSRFGQASDTSNAWWSTWTTVRRTQAGGPSFSSGWCSLPTGPGWSCAWCTIRPTTASTIRSNAAGRPWRRKYASYEPHLDGHGTIASSRSIDIEEAHTISTRSPTSRMPSVACRPIPRIGSRSSCPTSGSRRTPRHGASEPSEREHRDESPNRVVRARFGAAPTDFGRPSPRRCDRIREVDPRQRGDRSSPPPEACTGVRATSRT
jgi:hypothetical protein